MFANDSLLFFRRDDKSIDNIQCVLQWYYSISGQSINVAKSDLFCSSNMPSVKQQRLASALKVNLVSEPSKYLGLNFKLKGKRVADFHYMVDKLSSKLQRWKAKLLSQAGRTTLIHSVVQSLPLYTFSCFRVPESICNKLDPITRSFWWGHDQGVRKLHLLNWNRVCQPRNRGGLGLKKFSLMNQAMLAKKF